MKKLRNALLFCLLLTIFLVPFSIQAASGLTISPPISDISLTPGQTVTRIIRINNPTADLIEVYPRVMNFKAGGDSGEPAFYDVGDGSEKFAIANWISFSQTKLALAPEQIVEFEYTIKVPSDAEPGGHYGAVFFANEPETSSVDSSKVNMGSMIGSLLLIRTPGDVVEKGLLAAFESDKAVYLSNKVAFTTKLNNSGNVHFKPLGSITVKDIFGRKVDSVTFNEQGGNVLPDSTRKYTTNWQTNKFLLGYYEADLSLNYGQNSNTFTGVTSFWVIPVWFMVCFAILLAIVLFFILRFIFRRKGPKARKPKPSVQPQRPIQPQPRPQSSEPKGPIILR